MSPARYIQTFGLTVIIGLCLLAGFNVAAEAIIARSPQAQSLEMLSAFARVIKPAWLAGSSATTVVIGTSRVRDGFDPPLVARETGVKLFNYGVSGATAYETFRYTQDALARPQVDTVIIGAASFAVGSAAQPVGSGFDEDDLARTAAGAPTPRRGLSLLETRYLSGGAVGLNVQALTLLARLGEDAPSQRPDLFEAYSAMDIETLREGQSHHLGRSLKQTDWQRGYMERALDQFCGGRVKAYVFFPPDHFSITAAWAANNEAGLMAFRRAVVASVERHNRQCGARIALYDFSGLSRVTAETITPGQRSLYYREAVHYRPTVGVMILRRMLSGRPLASAPDFGVELTGPGQATTGPDTLSRDLARWREAR